MPHPAGPQELAALEPRFGANLEGLAGKEGGEGHSGSTSERPGAQIKFMLEG